MAGERRARADQYARRINTAAAFYGTATLAAMVTGARWWRRGNRVLRRLRGELESQLELSAALTPCPGGGQLVVRLSW